MRILQVIQSLKVGGAERVCLDLARIYGAMGHQVKVVLLQDRVELALPRLPDGQILQVEALLPGQRPVWVRSLPTLGRRFRRLYEQERWDVVHCHMDGALAVAYWGGAGAGPLIYTIHNSIHEHWRGVGLHRIRALMEWFYAGRRNVRVVGCGPGAAQWADQKLLPGRGRGVVCIPNGVDVDQFQFVQRDPWEKTDGPLRILMVGKMSEQKDYRTAIRAAYALNRSIPVRLRIAGDGTLMPMLRSLVEELDGGRTEEEMRCCPVVEFLGNRDDVPALLADSHLFWLTSRYEGLPLVLLEAMAAGVLVLATDVPGIREVAAPARVPLVPDGDPEAIAASTIRMLEEDLAGQPQLLRFRREQVEQLYSVRTMAHSYLKLMETMIEPSS